MIYASRYLRYEVPYMEGPDVLYLQEMLQERGYYSGSLDGVFSSQVESALRVFQRSIGILEDGIAGPDTWVQLNNRNQGNYQDVSNVVESQTNITIDVNRRKLYFQSPGLNKVYPVAVGKPSTPSPLGYWVITQKAVNPGGPFGVRWMRLSVPWGGYGIHGTNNPRSIGKAVSHGCIRMYNDDVSEIYPLTPIGTPVAIVGRSSSGAVLGLGSSGLQVKEVQQQLHALGYYSGLIDGHFGKKTRTALLRFQGEFNLPLSGKIDLITMITLQKAYDQWSKNREP